MTTERVLEGILVVVVAAAGVGPLLDDALPVGLALVGIAVMIGRVVALEASTPSLSAALAVA